MSSRQRCGGLAGDHLSSIVPKYPRHRPRPPIARRKETPHASSSFSSSSTSSSHTAQRGERGGGGGGARHLLPFIRGGGGGKRRAGPSSARCCTRTAGHATSHHTPGRCAAPYAASSCSFRFSFFPSVAISSRHRSRDDRGTSHQGVRLASALPPHIRRRHHADG